MAAALLGDKPAGDLTLDSRCHRRVDNTCIGVKEVSNAAGGHLRILTSHAGATRKSGSAGSFDVRFVQKATKLLRGCEMTRRGQEQTYARSKLSTQRPA